MKEQEEGSRKRVSRRGFVLMAPVAVCVLWKLPSYIKKIALEDANTSERRWVQMQLQSSSDFILGGKKAKEINAVAEESFRYANTSLKKVFPKDVSGFSVVGVTQIQIDDTRLFGEKKKQSLINLIGQDTTGIFSVDILKMDERYYPLFNLSEFPAALKETPERMPMILMPKKDDEFSYEDMYHEASFQVTKGYHRIVHLEPTKEPPNYIARAWLMDFKGGGLPDIVYDGKNWLGVVGGIDGNKLKTASENYKPEDQKYFFTTPFETHFYIKREHELIKAINENGKTIGHALRDPLRDVWDWFKE